MYIFLLFTCLLLSISNDYLLKKGGLIYIDLGNVVGDGGEGKRGVWGGNGQWKSNFITIFWQWEVNVCLLLYLFCCWSVVCCLLFGLGLLDRYGYYYNGLRCWGIDDWCQKGLLIINM